MEFLFPIIYPDDNPADLVREAFARPYGQGLIAAFAAAVEKDAGAACLQAKKLDRDALMQRGRNIFHRYGTRMLDVWHRVYDGEHFQSQFAALGGPNAYSELARLASDADVQRYVAVVRPVRLGRVVDIVVENFERYLLLFRIKLRPFSLVATGGKALEALDPWEQWTALREANEKIRQPDSQPYPVRVTEYRRLSIAMGRALSQAYTNGGEWGPGEYFAGLDQELTELCISYR
jgi:hypothetical protein